MRLLVWPKVQWRRSQVRADSVLFARSLTMAELPSAVGIEPTAVHIDFPYSYSVDGLQCTGRVSCAVDHGELDRKASTSLDSRIVR